MVEGEFAIVTCHGGAAVRRALESALEGAGLVRTGGGHAPPLFGARSRLQRETLALLQQARGERAVRETLRALREAEPALRRALSLPAAELARVTKAAAAARFLYRPPRIQLRGVVNSGKSSLLNALCGRRLAATGAEPGLTRDVIEGECEHRGVILRIFDAPGLRADAPELERRATALAEHWRKRADLTLELLPGGEGATKSEPRLMQVASKADLTPGRRGVSVSDPQSLLELKDRLLARFFGPLAEIEELLPGLLLAELRRDLEDFAPGREALLDAWLS